jgi:TolB-like protein/Flp pilus assembly protein TadD
MPVRSALAAGASKDRCAALPPRLNRASASIALRGRRVADVFLSYKREDAARVRKLVAALRKVGLDVWWDEDIPPSAPWEAAIEQALAAAKAVIVCWSPASVASENVRSEARVAREDGRLIQVFVEPSAPPLFFGERQGLDLSKWRGNVDDPRIGRLAETVRKIAAGEREGGERPTAPRSDGPATMLRQLPAIAAVLLIMLAAGTLIAYRAAIARPPPEVAVLPFEDLSPGHDKAYFAEGVAEEVLSSLSTDKAIKVLGRTSARQIDRNADPKTLRRSLGITHLLEGSARTAGDSLRVDVRLIDTSDGITVWQEEYQGRLSDIFSVQDRIASAVVKHLRSIFVPASAVAIRPPTKVNVYETYLAARTIMRKRSEPTLRQALGLAHQVITADPNYAAGQALYAELVSLLSNDPASYGDIPVARAGAIAQEHARFAIRLAPNQADGYAALGLSNTLDDETAIAALKRAIVLDPSRADIRIWLALRLQNAGRYDEALVLMQDAAAIEPLWPLPLEGLVKALAMNGQLPQARQTVQLFRQRGGNEAQYYRLLFLIDIHAPDLALAITEGDKAYSLDPTLPDLQRNLMSLYYTVGLQDPALKDVPDVSVPLAKPFYSHNATTLEAQIRTSGVLLWNQRDRDLGLFQLAMAHDWVTLNRLYDSRPKPPQKLCFGDFDRAQENAQALIPALRAAGRQADADALLGCLRDRLSIEGRQKARAPSGYFGDFEYDQSTLAAFAGNREAAMHWLEQAVSRGWLGRPYSPSLSDRPQFDAFRSDPRMAALQARIDRTIAQQRAKALGTEPK